MSKVNLIPDWVRNSQDRQRHQRFWIVVVAAVAVMALTWVSVKYLVYMRADREFRRASQGYTYLDNQLKLLARTETRLARLQGRLAVVKELGCYVDCLEIVGFLTQQTPAKIYLRDITVGRPKEVEGDPDDIPKLPSPKLPPVVGMFALRTPPQIAADEKEHDDDGPVDLELSLTGNGPTHLVTATYLTILSEAPFFTNVVLKHATRTSFDPADAIEFEIVCTLNPSTASHGMTEMAHDYQQ